MLKHKPHKPVFLDLNGRRARIANFVLLAGATICVLGLILVVSGVVIAPNLPAVPQFEADGLPFNAPPALSASFTLPVSPHRNRHVAEGAAAATRLAFFAEAQEGSVASLQKAAPKLDGIVPDWLQIDRDGIQVNPLADQERAPIVGWLRRHAPHVSIYPLLTSDLYPGETAALLADVVRRAIVVEQIADYLRERNLNGVVVKLGYLPPSNHRNMAAFLGQLGHKLHAQGRKVILVAEPGDGGSRLQELGRLADYVLIAAHDETVVRSGPGPAASQGWFEEQIWSRASLIPSDKLIISIGSFGYAFDSYGTKRAISVQQAWELMERSGARLSFDKRTLNPSFTYQDGEGHWHDVWFLDAVTAFNQVKAALAVKPAGIAIWRLGLEEPGLWHFAGRRRLPDTGALERLRTAEAGLGGYAQARGVLLGIGPGRAGTRAVGFDRRLGLITAQAMERVPQQAEFVEWHATDPKALALTFDDGPDPRYTPQILDMLNRKGAKATFYVLGTNALSFPDLLARVYDEGHDIGNHSYSHPNLYTSGAGLVAVELNATQRIIESQIGVRTTLFRPPFAATGYGYLETSPHLTATTARLGYLYGGIGVGSYDYAAPADWVVDEVVRGVLEGKGQALLFHDGGGNRDETIEALPRIIDRLQAAGYRFVTTHELIGLQRDDLMPPLVQQVSQAQAELRFGPVRFVTWTGDVLPTVAIVSAILGVVRLVCVAAAAAVQGRRRRRAKPESAFGGTIAVLVPAFNEEAVICKTVHGLLGSTIGDRLEILTVDDGSTDRTSEVVAEAFGNDCRVRVFRKENGGKAAALNYGISRTSADVIVAIDGDTVLLPDAIERLTARFNDQRVGAVAGKVTVGNRINLMTRFQALEYVTSQNMDRRAFELVNGIGVVPGAIGAWRRAALIEAGGYSTDTLAEDADLTITLERLGWKVVGEPAAQALTEAPETLRTFMKQRYRWMFGMLQVAFKHIGALAQRPTGVSLVTIPNILLFQFGFTLLAPLMDVLLVWCVVHAVLSMMLGLGSAHGETLMLLLQFWILFQTADVLAAVVGIALDGERGNWRLLLLVVLQRFTYRQLLYITAIRALLAAVKGTLVGWGKLVRTGHVTAPPPFAGPRVSSSER